MSRTTATAADDVKEDAGTTGLRSIGRWFIGETLGKGGYSWVKKGFDKKTGRAVALKFMSKADVSWEREQEKQVVTEIESLKKVRHKNVMKLYAYNMNAKYPHKDGTLMKSILLVLEYAPGGELFDILYYTSALEPIIARTYFKQFMAGLHACHAAGVCHRDLKPQNLLLDAKFQLKITDFGLSKVFHSDSDTVMRTTYVGTRGYQAPELLLKRPFDLSCDVFSAGVILFISLTGYPPFEQASKSDRWFRPIAKRDAAKFWELHAGCPISKDEGVKDLIFKMLTYDPKKRITMELVSKHEWVASGKVLEGKDLIRVLRVRHRKMESARRRDTRKMKDLVTSVEKARAIPGLTTLKVPLYPAEQSEGVWDAYTTVEPTTVLNVIYDVVGASEGAASFDFDNQTLFCSLKLVALDGAVVESMVNFIVRVFRSRLHGSEDAPVYAVRVQRASGDILDFRRVLTGVVFKKCGGVLTGLPEAIRRGATPVPETTDEESSEEVVDDYDEVLAGEGLGF